MLMKHPSLFRSTGAFAPKNMLSRDRNHLSSVRGLEVLLSVTKDDPRALPEGESRPELQWDTQTVELYSVSSVTFRATTTGLTGPFILSEISTLM